ncbi:ZYRO0A03762p [Zygosaccharomyces rouxii]|uniref:ZYRO0A03762p n=1 Tax=Zygosaccharomyces rouxii (strain ATCC 2623 / CBS 732 / NBRC 1130 / NCYC 568 / NRRL Y-229) TaxID=559307 RepID=C5DPJ0_ZYGRC|nr:uncharacterized protein ZYRO0A03762g [Zygosaccharomyces rouxii]KAH9198879.1 hypothetical protein LQ764DRAFT_142959 [Zygosaccharomyces rouxii]CAR25601.1 ZYRO0A03762p [Zygosaccharomyces rouxii]
MKVYGKRSGSLGIYASQNNSSEVELSDYESEPEPILESNERETVIDNSTDDIRPMTSDSKMNPSVDSSLVSSVGSNVSNLKAFDFLDKAQAPKKRRRIYHEDHSDDTQDKKDTNVDENPLNRTINDLNTFVSSLKSSDETLLQDTFKKELEKSVEDGTSKNTSGKLTYDRSRTMLMSKDEEEGLEAEDEEPKPTEDGDTKDGDDSQTYHINELKNMGDMLQYQDDLELLLEGTPSRMSRSQFVSHLLNIALAMNGDQEFCRYVNKRQARDMWRRTFHQMDFHDDVLLLIQGFLATKFQLPPNELPKFFNEFIQALYKRNRLPINGLSGNKIAQLNYNDFLHNTQDRTGQEYVLELCVQYPGVILSCAPLVNRIVQTLVASEALPRGIFPVVEKLASSGNTAEDANLLSVVSNKLIDLLPNNCQDDHLIKSLILFTNEETLERNSEVFHTCMKFVLDHLPPLGSTDILILHLGLCLNVISGESGISHLENALWLQAQTFFHKLESNDDDSFLLNMFYLNFAYMTVLLNKRLPTKVKTGLISHLELFAQESQHYNGSISDKIKYVTDKL